MKLTSVCGLSCLMYRCSPHRISWMLCGGYWVLSVFCQISITNLHTQYVSVVSQQTHSFPGQFAAACLKGGRNGIVFYTDPDVGATATASLAEHLLLEQTDDSEEEVSAEVEE